jgi:AcrR family transcriptional regulator
MGRGLGILTAMTSAQATEPARTLAESPAADPDPLSGSPVAKRGNALARRKARQAEIVASTRLLFDGRGMRSANIDDIAKAVGVNRAIIYRHFASKEELFALTLAGYLVELDERLSQVDDRTLPPRDRLTAVCREFAGYCLHYPAFVDCALALLGRPGADLLEEISETTLARLGALMAGELSRIADILMLGAAQGPEPTAPTGSGARSDQFQADLLANALYMQVLGVMHLARSGFIVRPAPGGAANWTQVADDQIVDLVTRMALSVAFPGSVPA